MNMQYQESKELNVEESGNFMRKPDLKLKKLTPRRQAIKEHDAAQESSEFQKSMENNSFYPGQNYQPVNIEYRAINIEPVAEIS